MGDRLGQRSGMTPERNTVGVPRPLVQRVGLVAAKVAICAGATGLLGWALRRFGPSGWRFELDVIIVASVVVGVLAYLISIWSRLRLKQ
jgi:hypothetical protein